MKRSLLITLATVVWAGISVPSLAATQVSGHVTSDTVWTLAGSPYLMVDVVTVDPGVVLTIEPGVVIQASSVASLDVQGTLHSIGTSDSPIVFEPYDREAIGTYWKGIRISAPANPPRGESAIRHTEIVYVTQAALGITASKPEISHNTFFANAIGVQLETSSVSITDNAFVLNNTGVSGRHGQVELLRNDFWMNREAVRIDPGGQRGPSWEIHQNDIISTPAVRAVPPGGISGSSCECDIRSGAPFDASVDAVGNWWGTTDPQEIEDRIVDGKDDPGYGTVEWSPPSAAPNTPWDGHIRSVSLTLRKHLLVSGRVSVADGFFGCASGVSVQIQRNRNGVWETVATAVTGSTGSYKKRLPDRKGSYRAYVLHSLSGPPGGHFCSEPLSPNRKHLH